MVIVDGIEKGLNLKIQKGEAEAEKRFEILIKVISAKNNLNYFAYFYKPKISTFLNVLKNSVSTTNLGETVINFFSNLKIAKSLKSK